MSDLEEYKPNTFPGVNSDQEADANIDLKRKEVTEEVKSFYFLKTIPASYLFGNCPLFWFVQCKAPVPFTPESVKVVYKATVKT